MYTDILRTMYIFTLAATFCMSHTKLFDFIKCHKKSNHNLNIPGFKIDCETAVNCILDKMAHKHTCEQRLTT